MIKKNILIICIFMVLVLFTLVNLVSAGPSFNNNYNLSYGVEDQLFSYNFTANVTNYDPSDTFSLINISSSQSSQILPSFYPWISLNTTSGVMTINSTNDTQSGRYNITLQVQITQPVVSGSIDTFFFVINATNDAPLFTSINNLYNMTVNQTFTSYINASDEEKHYPLYFNISFVNCSNFGQFNIRAAGNCSLFNFLNFSNTSAIMNFTPSRNDVGTYSANISVRDWGEHYNSTAYPYQVSNYSQNMTTFYSQLVNFTVFAALDINSTNCENMILQQNKSGSCWINITTRSSQDTFNVSSNASLRNYAAGNSYIYNSSWFFGYNQSVAVNYSSSVLVNVTPQATEVGNWTINFTLWDINASQSLSVPIQVYVNKTINYNPQIINISNQTAALNVQDTININTYDNDLLIPDKNESYGGYNETLNFTAMILNRSNLTQTLTINGANNLTVTPIYFSGTNWTIASIVFTPNPSSGGNYTINFSAVDKYGMVNSTLFNLSINLNHAPVWNNAVNFTIWENNFTSINFSSYVSDQDGDALNFTFTNDTSFPSFTINKTTGNTTFTPSDADVGQHLVNVTASDQYVGVSYLFNITVYNVPDNVSIKRPINVSGGGTSIDNSTSNINSTELPTTITVYADDNDLLIPQKSFYNESLFIANFSLTGVSINTTLFNFTKNTTIVSGSNRTQFYATFTPRLADVGYYNVTLNISDMTNRSDTINFYVNISEFHSTPNLTAISNITTAVTRSLYYRFNATDFHYGNSTDNGNTNFIFYYSFLNGTNFINNNTSIFNLSSGELNITFNSSQSGAYRLNITVSNPEFQNDSKAFWIFVYGYPSITFPLNTSQFYLAENYSYNFTFIGNNTFANNIFGLNDNLTYVLYLDSWNHQRYLISNFTSYGNGTNVSYSYTPNFTAETNGIRNLTLISYSSTNAFNNSVGINTTAYWNMTINHTYFPLTYNSGLSSKVFTGVYLYNMTLTDYFTDYDAADPLYNKTVIFNYTEYNSSNGAISVNTYNWINASTPSLLFTSSIDTTAFFVLTAYEYNESNNSQIIRNITTDSFAVQLTAPPGAPPSPGSNTVYVTTPVQVPVSLKIIVPGKVSGFSNQKIIIPLKLTNKGTNSFSGITLNVTASKNGTIIKDFKAALDTSYFSTLNSGESKDVTLTAYFATNKTGDYEITVTATSQSPVYSDWGKILINLQKINETDVQKFIVFTDEFITQNPSCLELKEQLNEAKALFDSGDLANARAKTENILNLCKNHVEQISLPSKNGLLGSSIILYFIIALVLAIVFGLTYYYIMRRIYSKTPIGFKSNGDELIGGKSR